MNKNIIEEYLNKVYVTVLFAITGASVGGGIGCVVFKLLGFYASMQWRTLLLFFAFCIVVFAGGLLLISHAYEKTEDGTKRLKPNMLKLGKLFVLIIEPIQFNIMFYMIPTKQFWAYTFCFLLFAALFMDMKLTMSISVMLFVSIIIGFVVKADAVLPEPGQYFVPEICLQVIALVAAIIAVLMVTRLVSCYLVNLKEEEIEENNKRVENVINTVSDITMNLSKTGVVLSGISQDESSSARELTVTSTSLLEKSTHVLSETESSRKNMEELIDCSLEMDENINSVEVISQKLLRKSADNEVLIKELQDNNTEVFISTERTKNMSSALMNCVEEITNILSVIGSISNSISMLALNASIEAARAGEAGRGFAVVAGNVGSLATNTKTALSDIEKVIAKLQDTVWDMATCVEDNTVNLNKQNETFVKLFISTEEVISVIQESLEAVTRMNSMHQKQHDIIQTTITINDSIIGLVQSEDEKVANITEMINENTINISRMTEQAEVLAGMITDLKERVILVLKEA